MKDFLSKEYEKVYLIGAGICALGSIITMFAPIGEISLWEYMHLSRRLPTLLAWFVETSPEVSTLNNVKAVFYILVIIFAICLILWIVVNTKEDKYSTTQSYVSPMWWSEPSRPVHSTVDQMEETQKFVQDYDLGSTTPCNIKEETQSKIQCPGCGSMIPTDTEFCPECGTTISPLEPTKDNESNSASDRIALLKELKKLLDEGVLTLEEFNEQKAQLLKL